jgi:hypothetical protein
LLEIRLMGMVSSSTNNSILPQASSSLYQNMKESGKMINNMVMDVRHGKMVPTILEFTLILRRKELVSTSGPTVISIRATGSITKSHPIMDITRVASHGMMVNSTLVNGTTI